MDQTRCCGWVVFVLTSKFFFWFIASEEVKFKIETASRILLSHRRKVKTPSRFSHCTKPTGTVIFWEAGCCLFSVWGANLLPMSMEFSHKNNVWFLQFHGLPPPYISVTSLWCLQSARGVIHNGTLPKKKKKLIVKDSKVIERLGFASKTVQSCVHLSQRRLRKFWEGEFCMACSSEGQNSENPNVDYITLASDAFSCFPCKLPPSFSVQHETDWCWSHCSSSL